MGVHSGPRIVTDGLILNLSPSSVKNYELFSTNFLTNGAFSGGTKITQESGSSPTNEIVRLENPGDSDFVLRQSGTAIGTQYRLNLTNQLVASTTYVMSGWYAKSLDYNGTDTMFHARAYSTAGNHIATAIGTGTTLYSIRVGGLLWSYCYLTIITPSDYNNVFEWYVGYGTTNTAGFRYYTNLKVERGTFPSLFDHSGRGNDHNYVGNVSYANGEFTTDGVNASGYARFSASAMNGVSTNGTVVIFYKTTDTQELWVRGNQNNGVYLSASAGNNYYHGSAGASITNFVDLQTTVRPDTPINYRNGAYHMWEAKGVDFSGWNTLEWFQYPSGWPLNGTVSNILVYNKSLSANESRQNFYALKSRYAI